MSGNWWSVFSTVSLIWMIAIIIGMLVAVPTTMISIEVLGAGSSSSVFIGGIGAITATVVAIPVIAIGYSLLYYDLRCRREDLYLDVLNEESTSDLGSQVIHGKEIGNQEGGSRNQFEIARIAPQGDNDTGSAG